MKKKLNKQLWQSLKQWAKHHKKFHVPFWIGFPLYKRLVILSVAFDSNLLENKNTKVISISFIIHIIFTALENQVKKSQNLKVYIGQFRHESLEIWDFINFFKHSVMLQLFTATFPLMFHYTFRINTKYYYTCKCSFRCRKRWKRYIYFSSRLVFISFQPKGFVFNWLRYL